MSTRTAARSWTASFRRLTPPPLPRTPRRSPRFALDARELADLELIATGAASPLTGFLVQADYQSVLDRLRLADGTVWPLPFTLAVQTTRRSPSAKSARSSTPAGALWGTITVTDVFTRDPTAESRAVYGTDDAAHPGVAYLLGRPTRLVGGPRAGAAAGRRPCRSPSTASRRASCARASAEPRVEDASPASRRATRFIARTSTSPSSRSR